MSTPDVKALWDAMPRDVQRKTSLHDLRRIVDGLKAAEIPAAGETPETDAWLANYNRHRAFEEDMPGNHAALAQMRKLERERNEGRRRLAERAEDGAEAKRFAREVVATLNDPEREARLNALLEETPPAEPAPLCPHCGTAMHGLGSWPVPYCPQCRRCIGDYERPEQPPRQEGETPETDELATNLLDSPVNIETTCEYLMDHSRKLERERNAAERRAADAEEKADCRLRRIGELGQSINQWAEANRTLSKSLRRAEAERDRLRSMLQLVTDELYESNRSKPAIERISEILSGESFSEPDLADTRPGTTRFVEVDKPHPTVVCFCGSSKWPDAHMRQMMEETLAGRIVVPMGLYGHADFPEGAKAATNDGDESTEVKQMLDRLHFAKIDIADEILVMNVGGYIGSSTQREIAYAASKGKRVRYLEDAAMSAPSAKGE